MSLVKTRSKGYHASAAIEWKGNSSTLSNPSGANASNKDRIRQKKMKGVSLACRRKGAQAERQIYTLMKKGKTE